MNSWFDPFTFSISGAALLLCAMGLWFTAILPGLDRWNRRFFLSYFTIFTLICLSGVAELVFQHYIVPRSVFVFLLLLESLLTTLPQLFLTVLLLHYCDENIRSSKLFHTVLGLWAVFFILVASSLFIEGFFYVTAENQYYLGSLYSPSLLPVIAIQLLNLIGTIRRRKRISRKVFLALVIAILPMTVTLFIHMFVDIFRLVDICTVLSALSMYGLILSDQIERERRGQQEIVRQQLENARQKTEIAEKQREIAQQQRKIANQRANIMVLQMRPHFIYNTLMSIYSLCNLEPRKARQITLDFTNYLRRNFNAVASDSTIPFAKELEHTRAYMAVEQAQYDDKLIVDYDTPYTQFRLPPLTLQPIVENAVKHGIDPEGDPLCISIRTRYTDSTAEIIVDDNGPGFDPYDGSKPHTTLENIRQRLEMMCGGSMTIQPREGGGTVVTITIPDSTERKKEAEEL